MSPDACILKALRAGAVRGQAVSAARLIAESGMEKNSALFSRIDELRAAGYEIAENSQRDSSRFFQLVSTPDRLIADDIASRLEDSCRLAREILVFEKTNSTNDAAAQLGRSGAAEGVVVFAETQTAGRGRLGRKWESAPGDGLWFSMLLRPKIPFHAWMRLTTWAAVGVAQGIDDLLLPAEKNARENLATTGAAIKWPNDIFVGEKKVAGILIESQPNESNGFAVAGIGVNVNQRDFPEALAQKAISLRGFAGRQFDRQELAAAILRRLDEFYSLHDSAFPAIIAAAERRSFLRGRWIEAERGGEKIAGVAESLDENGALRLREKSGASVTMSSGEVTIFSASQAKKRGFVQSGQAFC